MPGNGLTVVSLRDRNNTVVGYAAGTAAETALAAATVYAPSDPVTGTAVDYLKEVLKSNARDVRSAAEADGVLIGGNLYDTRFESQVKYLGSLLFATRDTSYTGKWNTLNNGYITLDSLGVYTICSGIMTYLQNCAVWEQSLIASITAATTVSQLQAIDLYAGKPVGSAGLPPPSPGTSTPPPLTAGAVNVADVVANTCTISGLTTSGSLTTSGNITCNGAFSTATFALASVNTGAVTATSVTAGSGTITTTGATSTGSLAVSGNATVSGALGAGATTVSSLSTGTLTITGTQTAGTYLRSNGTAAFLSAIQAADVPTLNQNTTGTAANVTATTNATIATLSALSLPVAQLTGTLSVANGGTGSSAALTQYGVKYASTTAAEATTAAGTTGLPLLANTVTGPAFGQLSLTAGVAGTLPIANGGTGATTAANAITALTGTQTSGTYLRSNGTAAALSAIVAADVPTLNQNTTGTATNVTATTNATLTTLTAVSLPVAQLTGTLAVANGGTGSSTALTQYGVKYASSATAEASTAAGTTGLPLLANTVTGPAFGQLSLTAGVAGTLPIANGGTGATTAANAITALTGTQTAGTYLRSNGTAALLSAIQAADVPTLNQNTTGTAANVTATTNSTLTTLSALSLPGSQVTGNIAGNAGNVAGTVAISNGGTGATTAAAGITALTGTQTVGTYLRSNGTVAALSAIQAADVPTLNQNTTGTAANVVSTAAVTCASLSAGSGAISTTGTMTSGAHTATSLNAGSGAITTTGATSTGSLEVTGNAHVTGTLGAGATTVSSLSSGSIDAAGSVSSTNTENVYMGVDAGGSSRLGFVKKTLLDPLIAAGSATDMLFGHFSAGNILGGVSAGTFTQRLAISASTGAVTIANALSAASAAISGALTAGATTVSSLTAGSGAISTTGATSTGTIAATGNATVMGRLAVGTTSPQYQLDIYQPTVNADASFRVGGAGGAAATASILLAPFAARAGGPSAIVRAIDNSYSTDVAFLIADSDVGGNTVATERMRIKTTGFVGIGTTTPQSLLDVAGTVMANKFEGRSGVPTIVRGAGAGTTATVSLTATSSDSAGMITINPAGTITNSAGTVQATITFNSSYSTQPYIVIHPANAKAGLLAYWPHVAVTGTGPYTGFTLNQSNNAPLTTNAPATYTWNYIVMQ